VRTGGGKTGVKTLGERTKKGRVGSWGGGGTVKDVPVGVKRGEVSKTIKIPQQDRGEEKKKNIGIEKDPHSGGEKGM